MCESAGGNQEPPSCRGILGGVKAKMRAIKRTPVGRYSRDKVRDLVTAIHVLETPVGSWEVRTLGANGKTRRFEAKGPAIEHAFKLVPEARVFVHQREPRRVLRAHPSTPGGGVGFKETKLR